MERTDSDREWTAVRSCTVDQSLRYNGYSNNDSDYHADDDTNHHSNDDTNAGSGAVIDVSDRLGSDRVERLRETPQTPDVTGTFFDANGRQGYLGARFLFGTIQRLIVFQDFAFL